MGKYSGILFASDFDHTLSGLDGKIPPQNIDAIRAFMDEGGCFTISSGRSVELLRQKVAAIPVNAPCICFNGAACYDYAAEKLFYAQPLPDNAREILEAAFAFDKRLFAEVQRIGEHYVFNGGTVRDTFLKTDGVTPIHAEGEIPLPWMKIVLCDPDATTLHEPAAMVPQETMDYMNRLREHMLAACGDTCYVTRSLPRVIEIGAADSNKGASTRRLMRELGLHTLVCAGDAPNDLEMLLEADISFAPADCDATIRALPNVHLTVPCGEGCVADAIGQLDGLLGNAG